MTITFDIPDMSCEHCVGTITRAVKAVDGEAEVQADLAAHRVRIEAAGADADTLAAAIRDAGYTPTAVAG